MAAVPHPSPECASCGRPISGRFCSDCGEERLDLHDLTVRHFFTHAFHETFELDGKIWRTLRALLFHPGFLAAEYCAGRRRMYVNPFRFLMLGGMIAKRQEHEKPESESDMEKFHQRLEKFSEPLSFANVFMLALALRLSRSGASTLVRTFRASCPNCMAASAPLLSLSLTQSSSRPSRRSARRSLCGWCPGRDHERNERTYLRAD